MRVPALIQAGGPRRALLPTISVRGVASAEISGGRLDVIPGTSIDGIAVTLSEALDAGVGGMGIAVGVAGLSPLQAHNNTANSNTGAACTNLVLVTIFLSILLGSSPQAAAGLLLSIRIP